LDSFLRFDIRKTSLICSGELKGNIEENELTIFGDKAVEVEPGQVVFRPRGSKEPEPEESGVWISMAVAALQANARPGDERRKPGNRLDILRRGGEIENSVIAECFPARRALFCQPKDECEQTSLSLRFQWNHLS
jgi:hypothetical protein